MKEVFPMLGSIILGAVLCLLVVVAYNLLNDGEIVTETDDGKKLTIFKQVGTNGWIAGLISGTMLAFINQMVQKITLSTIWSAWAFLAVIIIGYILLGILWNQGGTSWGEAICFFLITCVPYLTLKSLVGIASAPWQNPTMENLFGFLPLFMIVAFAIYMVVDLLRQRQDDENVRRLSWVAVGVAIMLVLMMIISSCTGCNASGNAGTSDSDTDSPQGLSVRKLTPEDLEKLTIDKFKGVPETLLDSSLSPHDKERTKKAGFSDALTFGFEAKKSDKMYAELQEEILRNPVYGVTIAKALKAKEINGRKLSDLNPWIMEMIQKNKEGVFYWCEYRDDSGTIYVTEEYRCYAATLCVFLDRLVEQGVQTHQTSENWRLNDKLKNNERTGIKADYQYKKEALVLQYIAKNGKALFTIGFNIHDKRPEFFTETPKVRKTTSRSTPAPSSTPDSTPDSPTPTPTSDSDSPKTGYNKDPNLAPKENTEPNDDPGPGPDTNNGVGAIFSTEDQPENSNHYTSYEEYREDMEELAEINQNQKTGEDDNTPTVVVVDSENIDNNADEGTGYGGINSAMPIQDSATTNGHPVTSDIDGVPLDGPPD